LASPGRYSLCRSTRPGCEQRSAPAGSMGELSCCIADELVLGPAGRRARRRGAAGGSRPSRMNGPGCQPWRGPSGPPGELACCTADELVLVLPGIAPARVGVARVRYTSGGGTSSARAGIGLDELTSPLASQSCRSTRPGCEQRSAPGGSMGEFSCCIADELVL